MQTELFDYISAHNAQSFYHAFWFVFVIELPRFFIGTLLLFHRFRRSTLPAPLPGVPAISVIVPTHNDGEKLAHTLSSLRNQANVRLQIIVVNDGSTDETHQYCLAYRTAGLIDTYLPLATRGSKAAAVNLALSNAKHPFICVTDADTHFDASALSRALTYFHDPKVAAVGGNLAVANARESLITRVQAINYCFSILMGRIIRDTFRLYFVASGAFSMFRLSAIKKIGGWHFGPGEDSDVSTRLRLAGFRVRFSPESIAYTNVPADLRGLARQRLRWDRSMMRLRFRKYRHQVLNPFLPHFNIRLAISFLDIYFFQIIIPFLFLSYFIYLFQTFGTTAFWFMAWVQGFYMLLGSFKYLGATTLSDAPYLDWRWVAYVPLYSLVSVYCLRLVKIYASLNEFFLRGSYTDSYIPEKVRKVIYKY